jgi:hypothetical protein
MREWLDLSEVEFHAKITERMRATGFVGDVIPAMITYNVPGFILRELWPAAYAEWERSPVFMAFAIAEDGWGGRIDNVTSQLTPLGDGFELEFAKSYVLDCEAMLILARGEFPGGEDLAICRVPRGDDQTWESRNEPGVRLETSDGRVIDHNRVRGKVRLTPADVLPITRRRYTPLGIRIPRRELTSLSVIAIALLDHLGARPGGADGDILADREARILNAREAGRLSGSEMRAAVEILDVFFRVTAGRPDVHPFWENVRRMRDAFDRSRAK